MLKFRSGISYFKHSDYNVLLLLFLKYIDFAFNFKQDFNKFSPIMKAKVYKICNMTVCNILFKKV